MTIRIGPLLKTLLSAWVVIAANPGCDMQTQESSTPEIRLGDVKISRAAYDPQQYTLQMEVLNESSSLLKCFEFHAQATTAISSGDELQTRFFTAIDQMIGAGTRLRVSVDLESPFSVVSPEPLVLDEIRVGEFVFFVSDTGGETYTVSGWIEYPWTVEESR